MPKVIVYHDYYGRKTGCCGHVIQFGSEDGNYEDFAFSHPYGEDPLQWAKDLVEARWGSEHASDLDWENCVVVSGEGC